jgi:hypothetical protein
MHHLKKLNSGVATRSDLLVAAFNRILKCERLVTYLEGRQVTAAMPGNGNARVGFNALNTVYRQSTLCGPAALMGRPLCGSGREE